MCSALPKTQCPELDSVLKISGNPPVHFSGGLQLVRPASLQSLPTGISIKVPASVPFQHLPI